MSALSSCMFVHHVCAGGQKRASNHAELKRHTVVNCLGAELRFSGKTACALKHGASSPAPNRLSSYLFLCQLEL